MPKHILRHAFMLNVKSYGLLKKRLGIFVTLTDFSNEVQIIWTTLSRSDDSDCF